MARFIFTTRMTVLSAFIVFAIFIATAAISVQLYFSERLAEEAAVLQFKEFGEKVTERAEHLYGVGATIAKMLAVSEGITVPIDLDSPHPIVPTMAETLTINPQVYSMFVALPNDEYIQLTNLGLSEEVRTLWQAAPEDQWLEMRIVVTKDGRMMVKRYLSDQLETRMQVNELTDYRPTTRFWYQSAQLGTVSKTTPYRFRFTGNAGVSMTTKSQQGPVVGVGISLAEMVQNLKHDKNAQSLHAFVFDQNGQLIGKTDNLDSQKRWAHSSIYLTEPERQFLANSGPLLVANELDFPPLDFTVAGNPRGYFPELIEQLASVLGMEIEFVNGSSFSSLYQSYMSGELDLLQPMSKNPQRQNIGLFSKKVFDSKMVGVTRIDNPNNIRNLDQLHAMKVVGVRDYATAQYLQTHYPSVELTLVESSVDAMRMVESGEAEIFIGLDAVVQYLKTYYFMDKLKISEPIESLTESKDFDMYLMVRKEKPYLQSSLDKALASMDPQFIEHLSDKWLSPKSVKQTELNQLDLSMGQLGEHFLHNVSQLTQISHSISSIDLDGVEQYAFSMPIKVQLLGGDDVAEYVGVVMAKDEVLSPYLDKVKVTVLLSLASFFLLTPLALVLIRLLTRPMAQLSEQLDQMQRGELAQSVQVSSHIVELDRLYQGVKRTLDSLFDAQRNQAHLFDSLNRQLHLLAKQNDPHGRFGNELYWQFAQALWEKVSQSNDEFLKNQNLRSNQLYCVQVCFDLVQHVRLYAPATTMQKRTKLDVVDDRIHSIRLRFEILWREAEVTYWQSLAREPNNKSILRQQLEQKISALKEDYLFVCKCNLGMIPLDPVNRERLNSIAGQKWVSKLNPIMGTHKSGELISQEKYTYSPGVNSLISADYEQNARTDHLFAADELHSLLTQEPLYSESERKLLDYQFQQGVEAMQGLTFTDTLKGVPELVEAFALAQSKSFPAIEGFLPSFVAFCVTFINGLQQNQNTGDKKSFETILESLEDGAYQRREYFVLYHLTVQHGLHSQFAKMSAKLNRE